MKWLLLTLPLFVLAAETANAMAISEVAELQFHKINQLVDTRKIDRAFADHLKSVDLRKDTGSADYIVAFHQESDAGIVPAYVEVKADANGKAKSYQVNPGRVVSQPANWGGKAPIDLLEKAVEYVVDSTTDNLTPPFRDRFTSAAIEPLVGNNGLVGKVSVTAGPADGTLIVIVDLNGKVLATAKQ